MVIIALAGALPLSSAQGARSGMNATGKYLHSERAMADLSAINDRFIENFVHNDVAGHDRLLHPRFLAIDPDGGRTGRAAYLKRWATGFDPEVIVYWDVRDELITLIGNTALVRATNKQVVRRDGRDVASMSTYTDTYIYEDGRWWCIQAHITRVAPAREPGDETIKTVYIKGVKQPRSTGSG